jgi:hypothetical protein
MKLGGNNRRSWLDEFQSPRKLERSEATQLTALK